jgi:hypothetical protein
MLKNWLSKICKHHHIQQPTVCNNNNAPCIGILNWQANMSLQSLLNAQEIATQIQQANPKVPHIPITYFKGITFADQVRFFSSIDLLISPHGAQLMGIFFMLSPCGGVLELFPKPYSIPQFFGSLAETSDLQHYALYVSNETSTIDNAPSGRSHNVNLCPLATNIVQAAQIMMDDWFQCCAQYRASQTHDKS